MAEVKLKASKCVCQDVKIRVFYANICSMNPNNKTSRMVEKIQKLKNLISVPQKPHLISIVESWLTENHTDEQILDLLGVGGYEIFRHDRRSGHHPGNAYGDTISVQSTRRGGGVLVLWNKQTINNAKLERNPAEDHEDNVVNFDLSYTFDCKKCSGHEENRKFGFTVVYRRPSRFFDQDRTEYVEINQNVIDRLIHLPFWYNDYLSPYSGWAMVGDYNWNSQSLRQGQLLHNAVFCPLSSSSTHRRGAALDHVIASPGFVVNSTDATSSTVNVTDLVSDHGALIFSLKLGKDYASNEPCNAQQCV